MIDVSGMIRMIIKDEIFVQNGDNLVEITNFMRKYYPFISNDLSPNSSNLGSYSLANYIPSLNTGSFSNF